MVVWCSHGAVLYYVKSWTFNCHMYVYLHDSIQYITTLGCRIRYGATILRTTRCHTMYTVRKYTFDIYDSFALLIVIIHVVSSRATLTNDTSVTTSFCKVIADCEALFHLVAQHRPIKSYTFYWFVKNICNKIKYCMDPNQTVTLVVYDKRCKV